MGNSSYVHGYSEKEALRLNDQAQNIDELIHSWPKTITYAK